ncbi:TrkH family potassium uptake protein [Microbacterium halophytorum]|uniref:TrkH family potassium uptake protein n=1 Tax=Microbacterium halophytorum TaxID=2067568 RepID=UPI000CFDA3E1|nr:potassium transporter TrkG [Microbacterium halophytorum]
MKTSARVRSRLRTGSAPAQAIVTGFGLVALVGTTLLWLPISSTGGATSFVEALFTAVSALCVTGLVVVDTAIHWSPFGLGVIMVLIQLGGLGIMVFAALVGIVLARRVSVRTRMNTALETKSSGLPNVGRLVRNIALTSVVIEAVLAALLAGRFVSGYDYAPGKAIWHAAFHAVSAFNNAGFALYSDSMVGFVDDPWIALPISAAIVLGGLGFPVLRELAREWRTPLRWSMNTRIVLPLTAALLVVGWAAITAMEWENPRTLGAEPPGTRILAGLFHSVQTRTAGFNSVDVGAMNDETWLVMDVLMFIGAGPGGTAGGIKITTFGVLFFILLAELRGHTAVNVFGKRLDRGVHREAIAVVLLAIGAVVVSTAAILATTDFDLDRVLFETISAFSTVGLSTGITADLPEPAQMLLAALMFAGRIGPLTIGSALALRERRIAYELPKERPVIG